MSSGFCYSQLLDTSLLLKICCLAFSTTFANMGSCFVSRLISIVINIINKDSYKSNIVFINNKIYNNKSFQLKRDVLQFKMDEINFSAGLGRKCRL